LPVNLAATADTLELDGGARIPLLDYDFDLIGLGLTLEFSLVLYATAAAFSSTFEAFSTCFDHF